MSSEMAEAIRQLTQDKGYSQESVLQTIENMLKAAYKRTFGTNANAVVKFTDDNTDVSIYSRKVIVDGVYDPVTEIELEEAKQLSDECELGDEIDILIDPKEFDRSAVATGKQTAHQSLSEIQKDSLYSEYKDKVGEIILGYYQRERNGNIYVDLGKVEGILPAKFQSPRELYRKNDRIKALIVDLKKTSVGLQVVLSRTDPDFVRSIVELEVPEVYDKTVEIYKIVREPGYRTKIAVYSHREDIDPVGACVGLKGVRIQAVIRELEGEKIDILRYDPDPVVFIKNALSPAKAVAVVIKDEEKKQALAVVPEAEFSQAIGKQGLNVRLANKLADWNIDVKIEGQCGDLDSIVTESRRAAEELFRDNSDAEEISSLSELPGIDERVVGILKENNIIDVEDFIFAQKNDGFAAVSGLSAEDIDAVAEIISNTVEFVDSEQDQTEDSASDAVSEAAAEETDEEIYECPECGAQITVDMTVCPNCGIGLSFEYEDEE
ncbi:MAG: transcription termination factor NusA [Bacteroides sp.]|nr:transcription termination factor NusA [Prevotella sp.]MCM1407968.1 transcription termination factor NusA [Treponema brennaborense]MCM1469710.1 transcription termination factor NusA [Bacteroides sp.]